MDFYTGKPDRPIEHYGVVSHIFQTQYGVGFIKSWESLFKGESVVEQQSDMEALQTIAQLVLEGQPNANVIYEMRISIAYVPVSEGSAIVAMIYASCGRYKKD